MNVVYCESHQRFEMFVMGHGLTSLNEDVQSPHHYTDESHQYVHEGPAKGCGLCGKE